MNLFDNLSHEYNYQFPRWPSSLSRSHSSLPSKDVVNDMFKLGIDNRTQVERPDSSSIKRVVKHHVCIPTGSPRPLNRPCVSPDFNTKVDHPSPKPIKSRLYRSVPFRLKSACLSVPISKTKGENLLKHFPKQTHEQRKITHERKRQKQQAQMLADKYAESDTWFQLKQSLGELKRLAQSQDILIDQSTSSFNGNGQALTKLKQVINEENKKEAIFDSDSNDSIVQQIENNETRFSHVSYVSSSLGSSFSAQDVPRPSLTTSRNSVYRPRTAKRATETHPRVIFGSLVVASKPIHPLLLTPNHNQSLKSQFKPPPSPICRSRLNTTPLSEERRAQLLVSDLSNDDNPPISTTPPPPMMIKIEQETFPRKVLTPSPAHLRPPSSTQLTSTIKLKSQIPRCRSANDIKPLYLLNKNYPRFILIVDEEHRIESWYNQYPFIHSDDLLTSFQSKPLQQKSIISAFFIDDGQSLNPNIPAKTFLQGKPFHINNDWKKYDLIFISNNIYEKIIIYLQTIINLIKSSGKIINIYQINHQEDLKKQVKNICKQLQQQQNI